MRMSVAHIFKSVLVVVAAMVILFEEWLWEPLQRAMARLAFIPFFCWLATLIARLTPRAALAIHIAPMVLLFPFKIGGLWLIARGHAVLGAGTFLAAKVIGTAVFAWLFNLTKPALMQIAWFVRVHSPWKPQLSRPKSVHPSTGSGRTDFDLLTRRVIPPFALSSPRSGRVEGLLTRQLRFPGSLVVRISQAAHAWIDRQSLYQGLRRVLKTARMNVRALLSPDYRKKF